MDGFYTPMLVLYSDILIIIGNIVDTRNRVNTISAYNNYNKIPHSDLTLLLR